MEMRKLLGMAVLGLAIVSLGACGDDTPADTDGGTPDGGPDDSDSGVPEGNWDCVGTRPYPTGGEEVDVIFELHEFNANDLKDGPVLGGICVEVYDDNNVGPRMGSQESCNVTNGGVTDANGQVTVRAKRGSFIAYYAHGGTGTKGSGPMMGSTDTYIPYAGQYYKVPEDGEAKVQGVIINTILRDNIPNALYAVASPAKAALTGEILDCDEEPVMGMTLRVLKNGTVLESTPFVPDPTTEEELKVAYFNRGTPTRNRTTSNDDGLFLVLNAAIEGENDTVHLASCHPDGRVVGCVEGALIAGGVNSIGVHTVQVGGAECPADACQ